MVIKLRAEPPRGDSIRATIFIGVDQYHLQHAGTLTLHDDEWTMFGALLVMGAEQVKKHRARQGLQPDVIVMTSGWSPDKEVADATS